MGKAEHPAKGAEDWTAAFFRDADTLHLPTLMNWFDDTIDLRLGNMPSITGREGVRAAFEQFWSTLSGMSHECLQLVVDGDRAFQASIVTYTRLDARTVSIPVASHLRRVDGSRLDRLWIYIDLAPLYAEE